MQPDFVFSSESVTAGHPDKVCDQISDAIVDRYLRQDPLSRVAAECALSTGIVFLSVKARSSATVDAPSAAREVLKDAGYSRDGGFDARNCTVMTSFQEFPSSLLARVDEEDFDEDAIERTTAREPATVFGYACKDTPAALPLPIWLSHRLARRLSEARHALDYLSPDGKTQVAVEYRDGAPVRIDGVTVVACQRERAHPTPTRLADELRQYVLEPVLADVPVRADARTRFAMNPDGALAPGGPVLHAGLTGRKTAVDGYGDFARQGAAALSGKDPSRIDRVGSYAARHAAKHVVAAGLATRCELALSYSIGIARPVSINVETFGTGILPEVELAARLARVFDFRPAAIVRNFALRSLPARREGRFFRSLAAYGHVGREDLEVPWERLDKLAQLRDAA